MKPFENLAKALRCLRQHRRLRQDDLARAAQITRTMLSAYENGRRQPSLATLGNLLVALDADLADLQDALDRQRDVLDVPPRADDRRDSEGVH